MSAKLCKKFSVKGRVQGVFYRANTKVKAEELQIKGFARNEDDGTVTVMVCGEPDALRLLEDWLWEGPPAATVEVVVEQPCEDQSFDDFTVI